MKLGWVCTEAVRAQRLKSAQPSPGTVPQGSGEAKGTRWKRFLRDLPPWICRGAFPTLTRALTAWVEKGRAGTATGRMGVQGRQGLDWVSRGGADFPFPMPSFLGDQPPAKEGRLPQLRHRGGEERGTGGRPPA